MPRIAIILYKDVDYSGYDAYVEDIVPIKASDWYEVTNEELAALRTYYKPPPRRGYKLKALFLEQAEHEEISIQLKNCLALAYEAKEKEQQEEKKRLEAKKQRDLKKLEKIENEEKKLLKELLEKHPEVVK